MTPYEQYEKDVRQTGRTTNLLRMATELARLGQKICFVVTSITEISRCFQIVKGFENNYNKLSKYNNVVFNPIVNIIYYRDQHLQEIGSIEFSVCSWPTFGKTYHRTFKDNSIIDFEIKNLYNQIIPATPIISAPTNPNHTANVISPQNTQLGGADEPRGFEFL